MEKIKTVITQKIDSMSNQASLYSDNQQDTIKTVEFRCDLCGDKGYTIFEDDEGSQFLKYCMCKEIKQNETNLSLSGLESMVEKNNFATFNRDKDWQEKMYTTAINFVENYEENWFFIGGQVGSGKTHLCVAICYSLIKKGCPTKHMSWRETMSELKHFLNVDEGKFYDLISVLKKSKVLFIDDLFKSEKGKSPTSWEINTIIEILDYRYRNKNLITILSSEWSINQIIDIDESIGSRIFEKSKMYSIEISNDQTKNIRFSQ